MSVFVLQSKTITGQANQPTPQDVDKAVKTALKSKALIMKSPFSAAHLLRLTESI